MYTSQQLLTSFRSSQAPSATGPSAVPTAQKRCGPVTSQQAVGQGEEPRSWARGRAQPHHPRASRVQRQSLSTLAKVAKAGVRRLQAHLSLDPVAPGRRPRRPAGVVLAGPCPGLGSGREGAAGAGAGGAGGGGAGGGGARPRAAGPRRVSLTCC